MAWKPHHPNVYYLILFETVKNWHLNAPTLTSVHHSSLSSSFLIPCWCCEERESECVCERVVMVCKLKNDRFRTAYFGYFVIGLRAQCKIWFMVGKGHLCLKATCKSFLRANGLGGSEPCSSQKRCKTILSKRMIFRNTHQDIMGHVVLLL